MFNESKTDYAGTAKLAKLGNDLNTNYVLFGSFTIVDNQIQITTTIIDAKTQQVAPLIQDIYPINNLIEIVNDISIRVYKKLDNISAGKKS